MVLIRITLRFLGCLLFKVVPFHFWHQPLQSWVYHIINVLKILLKMDGQMPHSMPLKNSRLNNGKVGCKRLDSNMNLFTIFFLSNCCYNSQNIKKLTICHLDTRSYYCSLIISSRCWLVWHHWNHAQVYHSFDHSPCSYYDWFRSGPFGFLPSFRHTIAWQHVRNLVRSHAFQLCSDASVSRCLAAVLPNPA